MSLPSSVYVASLLASLHAAANIFTIACVPALAGIPFNSRDYWTMGHQNIRLLEFIILDWQFKETF